jgi:GxxExxY protein
VTSLEGRTRIFAEGELPRISADECSSDSAMYRPELTHDILGAFYDVYNSLQFGFLEAVYVNALTAELRERGHHVAREVPIDVRYKGQSVGSYRVDLLVDDAVVLEVKATRCLDPQAEHQLLNYLRATRLEVGLLLHFGVRPAFKRLVCTSNRGSYLRDVVLREDPR